MRGLEDDSIEEMTHQERIQRLNDKQIARGDYVLYWMQASQRAEYNHALEYSIERANELDLPVVVFFGITRRFPEANARHYLFMLEGLKEVSGALEKRGIRFVLRMVQPADGASELARRAALAVCDRGYLRIQRRWRADAARRIACPLVQVESDVVVPVQAASNKEEYAAATIRPKIHRLLGDFMRPVRHMRPSRSSLGLEMESVDIENTQDLLGMIRAGAVPAASASAYRGGTSGAKKRLRDFIDEKLDHFDELRNDPSEDCLSHMSPYLHFGQISPLYIALEVERSGSKGREAYLEELIVRRELSMNFVFFNGLYDSYEGLPAWCLATLAGHKRDRREYRYSEGELEAARTHDPYWNAAQTEMMLTGKMHGYMRMYWGKKILEWSRTPEEAFVTALRLNNRHELDGRDPNGFTGIAWCFGKHDRPWKERPVFGTVRYMNARGLERKFDIGEYVRRIELLKRSTG
jgi:deoxyribodipyrimidine photo-lyase